MKWRRHSLALRIWKKTRTAKEIIYNPDAPKTLAGYSQAVKSNGLIFISGQGPFDAKTGDVVGTTIQDHTAQCLANIAVILAAAGSSRAQAVSATIILGEETDFAGMNEVWEKTFPTNPPARHLAKLKIRPKGMKISTALIAEG